MKKISKLKLNRLSDANLQDKEMDSLRGGNYCQCSCYYEQYQGSSTSNNGNANYNKGTRSVNGCNQYIFYGSSDYGTCLTCSETNPGY